MVINMKDKLRIIQTLAKLGKTASFVIFILCIVGASACLAGASALLLTSSLEMSDGITLAQFIESKSTITVNGIYAACAIGGVMCIGEAIAAKYVENYFKLELNDGTPFVVSSAQYLRKVGTIKIVATVACTIISMIIYQIMANAFGGAQDISIDNSLSIVLGIVFVIASIILEYGAEQLNKR